jgi:hypothetical protein
MSVAVDRPSAFAIDDLTRRIPTTLGMRRGWSGFGHRETHRPYSSASQEGVASLVVCSQR